MASKSTPGYLYFVADLINLIIEACVYFVSLSGPVYLIWYNRDAHPLLLLLLGILGWLVAALVFILVLVIIKRLLIGEIPAGRYLLTSSKSYRWIFADRITKIMVRSPFRGLVTENAFYRYAYFRGMGMKFDSTLLLGPRAVIAEPWAVSAGHNVLIGADAVISGHKVEHKVVTLEPVEIGSDVLIGTRAVILPGVKIGNRVVIGANSVIARGTVIPDGETWAGNPAGRVDMFAGLKNPAPENVTGSGQQETGNDL
ncbi:MAG: DapH/DapD/GlmU-related protein [Anaerolineales bacterium]|jgi:acetyltransferase-like isoleucine patch superfamily enzyme